MRLVTECLVRLFSFDRAVKTTAMNTYWILHTKDDNGGGSAVLLSPKIAVTSAHNFMQCRPQFSDLISPRTGDTIKVKSASLDKINDIAILTLSKKSKEPTAKVDFETEVKTATPVIKGRLTTFDPRIGVLETVKGMIVAADEISVNPSINSEQAMCTLFHLRSKPGDSGAGIFSQEGGLLTINNTGNGQYGVSGTNIGVFRKIMKNIAQPQ
jgi:hypothetical protein